MSIKHYITEEEAWREIAWRMEAKHREDPNIPWGICWRIVELPNIFSITHWHMEIRLNLWRHRNDQTNYDFIQPATDKLLRARICRELAQEAQNG